MLRGSVLVILFFGISIAGEHWGMEPLFAAGFGFIPIFLYMIWIIVQLYREEG